MRWHSVAKGANIVATARTTAAIEAVVAQVEEAGSAGLVVTADLGVEGDIGRIADETSGKNLEGLIFWLTTLPSSTLP